MRVENLGGRICIIGPSSSGKSTLANNLANKLNIPVTHLDYLAYYHGSNWQRRSDSELIAAQSNIIKQEKWIIEGNYSICMPDRLQRATGVICLDYHPLNVAYRYIIRCIKNNNGRIGKLPGSQKEFSLSLLKHILCTYPKNKIKYDKFLSYYHIPVVKIHNFKALKQFSRNNGI